MFFARPICALALCMLSLLILDASRPVLAFDFFDAFFGGGQRQQQQQQHEEQQRRARQDREGSGECTNYICPGSTKACVADPRDCPCPLPSLETKCMIGDWYTCVSKAHVAGPEQCGTYLAGLNGGYGSEKVRSEL